MWTTRDGYVLYLPRPVLQELAAQTGATEGEVYRELERGAYRARRIGSLQTRKMARNHPVFRAHLGKRGFDIVARPIGGRPIPGPHGLGIERPLAIVGIRGGFAGGAGDGAAWSDGDAGRGLGPGAAMIVDGHCHAGKGDGLTGPWDTSAPLGDYLRRAARAGIDRTVIFAAFTSDYRAANREVAAIVAAAPARFFGFAFVNPARDAGRIGAMLREAVTRYGFCGVKVHRHDASITREVCEEARRLSLPILYDVMGEIHPVELLATEYPDVPFIIPHLGSFSDDWKAQIGLIDLLVRHPNVLTDTSGVRRFDVLEQAVRRAGAHKVIFGSDGPWLHPGLELAKIRALGLPPAEERMVLGGNMLRLIRRARHAAAGLFPTPSPGTVHHGVYDARATRDARQQALGRASDRVGRRAYGVTSKSEYGIPIDR
jgi:predicted TIM-barrel fold metal-dependent hydrolase